ncbi:hypothetical protein FB563_0873 [Streptomyces puniciscabiei]|uniref:Uncharacterized protein n=1 Tax=Streptomyces puniciscabiei TaxID=164348 RepID=A0A542UA32_9ACTN|nr:hypothetical protein [Streptomyces puniciscabiei]TQK95949.1 hypothetical protein FB563_0873 [Streptomyces puniciscabiei]
MTDSGTASATPQFLFDYSTTATNAARLLEEFVRGTLAPAVAGYQATAVDFGSHIFRASAGYAPGAPGTIDGQVTALLSRIIATDKHVALVGKLFQLAGGTRETVVNRVPFVNGPRPVLGQPPLAAPDPILTVFTDDAALAAAERSVGHYGAGNALALSFDWSSTDTGDLAPGLKQLAKYQDDQAFCVEFFNSLPPGTVAELIIYGGPTLNHALATAYASGLLDARVEHEVVRSLELQLEQPSGNPAPAATLNALAADPAAAAAFARYLSKDPKALLHFMGGLGYRHEADPGYTLEAQTGSQRAYLSLLTSAVPEMQPGEVKSLVVAMGAHFPDVTSEDLQAILPDIRHFLATAAGAMSGPLPSDHTIAEHPEALSEWANGFGANMRAFNGIYEHIAKVFIDAQASDDKVQGILTDAMFAVGFTFVPEGVMAAGVSLPLGKWDVGSKVASAVNEDLVKVISPPIPWPKGGDGAKISDFVKAMNRNSALYFMCNTLYSHGMITHRSGGKWVATKWPDLNGPDGPNQLFASLRGPHATMDDPATSAWAWTQHAKGGRKLAELINQFMASADSQPTSVPSGG